MILIDPNFDVISLKPQVPLKNKKKITEIAYHLLKEVFIYKFKACVKKTHFGKPIYPVIN